MAALSKGYSKQEDGGAAKRSRSRMKKSKAVVTVALVGNLAITAAKFAAWMHSGSSSMLSEAIHSLVDTGNQSLLFLGLRSATFAPDRRHQYGYGRSIYVWSLVSALATFWLGAGIAGQNSFNSLTNPALAIDNLSWDTWAVLAFSFGVDGYVLRTTLKGFDESRPKHLSRLQYIFRERDPSIVAVLLEDTAACSGVIIASAGILISKFTGSPFYDSMGGIVVSTLLAGMGLALARMCQRFLIGEAVDPEMTSKICEILTRRPSIEAVHSVQSQWLSPYTFSFKAEVDFDGTYIAAKLMSRYQREFLRATDLESDLKVLLAWYAEDVVRVVEKEVRSAEREIRERYPEAAYIELEPDSKNMDEYAIEDSKESSLRKLEKEAITLMLEEMAKSRKPS